jgi:hypothetical protein
MARARKAAGLPGSLGFHRAQVLLGMMLGTLPWIPPADGAPPDQPPPAGDDPGSRPEPGDTGAGAGHGPHDTSPRSGDTGPGAGPRDGGGAEDSTPGHDDGGPVGHGQPATPAGPGDNAPLDHAPRDDAPREDGPWDGGPAPRDEDAPEDDGLDEQSQPGDGTDYDPAEEDDLAAGKRSGPGPEWPELGTIPPALARPRQPADTNSGQPGNAPPQDQWPGSGLLEISLPWTVLAGLSDEPGALGRIGPITAVQARHLADAAAGDPAAQWRIIITNNAGQAIAVTRIRRRTRRPRDGPAPPSQHYRTTQRPPPRTGLVGRVTLTITQDTLAAITSTGPPAGTDPSAGTRPSAGTATTTGLTGGTGTGPTGEITAALRAAATALDQALAQAAEDAAAGGCAHGPESKAYRPPPRLRDYIAARDLTCRFPTCRMPAWRGDLDHTIPWDQGGRTCPCNLGGACRCHHELKQHPRWRLEQRKPGEFTWITPAGRAYTVGPDTYAA